MKRFIAAILFIMTAGYVATNLYLPSLPAIADALNATHYQVQLTIPLFMTSFGLSHLFFGPLSDKIGRRPVLLFGMLFSLIGTISCIFIVHISMLIIARFVQGIGLGAAVAVTRAAIRDISHGDQFAHISSIITIGAAAFIAGAPLIGGYLQSYFGWRSPFIFLTLYTIVIWVLTYFWIKETNNELNPHALKPKIFFRNYLHLITNPIFLGYSLSASSAIGGLASYLTASPFILQTHMNLSPVTYGWSVILIALGMALGGFLNRSLLRRFGRHRSHIIGISLLFSGGLLMLIAVLFHYSNPLTFVIPVGFYAIGLSAVISNGTAGAFTPFPQLAGFAGALFGCLFICGAAISSALITSFNNQSVLLIAIFLLIAALSSLLSQCVAFLAVDKK